MNREERKKMQNASHSRLFDAIGRITIQFSFLHSPPPTHIHTNANCMFVCLARMATGTTHLDYQRRQSSMCSVHVASITRRAWRMTSGYGKMHWFKCLYPISLFSGLTSQPENPTAGPIPHPTVLSHSVSLLFFSFIPKNPFHVANNGMQTSITITRLQERAGTMFIAAFRNRASH